MLVPFETQDIVLDALVDRAREYAEGSRSKNTVRAYESDLRAFCEWCRERSLTCLPGEPRNSEPVCGVVR